MSLPSRPTLLNIPRELRQHILGYVFEDVIDMDNRFNGLLREPRLTYYRSRNFGRCGYRRDENDGEARIHNILYLHSLFGGKWLKFDAANIYAPNIFRTAELVFAVNVEMADDVRYVLNQALRSLGRMQELAIAQDVPESESKRRVVMNYTAWRRWFVYP